MVSCLTYNYVEVSQLMEHKDRFTCKSGIPLVLLHVVHYSSIASWILSKGLTPIHRILLQCIIRAQGVGEKIFDVQG
jgi:hypothetical protein